MSVSCPVFFSSSFFFLRCSGRALASPSSRVRSKTTEPGGVKRVQFFLCASRSRDAVLHLRGLFWHFYRSVQKRNILGSRRGICAALCRAWSRRPGPCASARFGRTDWGLVVRIRFFLFEAQTLILLKSYKLCQRRMNSVRLRRTGRFELFRPEQEAHRDAALAAVVCLLRLGERLEQRACTEEQELQIQKALDKHFHSFHRVSHSGCVRDERRDAHLRVKARLAAMSA